MRSLERNSAQTSDSNGWKIDARSSVPDYRIQPISAISPRTEALEKELLLADERRGQLVQELQSENRSLTDSVKALRKDLTDCHVQISFLQRQLKIKAEEAASKANEVAVAERSALILRQRETEIADLQAKLSKERVQREAAERRVMLEKDETQKALAYQQDMKARIENFQEILVKETQERQRVQKRLADAEAEAQGAEALQADLARLREQNAEMTRELLHRRQVERDLEAVRAQAAELPRQAALTAQAEEEARRQRDRAAELGRDRSLAAAAADHGA